MEDKHFEQNHAKILIDLAVRGTTNTPSCHAFADTSLLFPFTVKFTPALEFGASFLRCKEVRA
jgi:hypothetical protein